MYLIVFRASRYSVRYKHERFSFQTLQDGGTIGATIMHNHNRMDFSGSRKQTSSERTEADTFNSKVKQVLYLKKQF